MELVGERQADLDEPGPERLDRPVQPTLTGEALAALCWPTVLVQHLRHGRLPKLDYLTRLILARLHAMRNPNS